MRNNLKFKFILFFPYTFLLSCDFVQFPIYVFSSIFMFFDIIAQYIIKRMNVIIFYSFSNNTKKFFWRMAIKTFMETFKKWMVSSFLYTKIHRKISNESDFIVSQFYSTEFENSVCYVESERAVWFYIGKLPLEV